MRSSYSDSLISVKSCLWRTGGNVLGKGVLVGKASQPLWPMHDQLWHLCIATGLTILRWNGLEGHGKYIDQLSLSFRAHSAMAGSAMMLLAFTTRHCIGVI